MKAPQIVPFHSQNGPEQKGNWTSKHGNSKPQWKHQWPAMATAGRSKQKHCDNDIAKTQWPHCWLATIATATKKTAMTSATVTANLVTTTAAWQTIYDGKSQKKWRWQEQNLALVAMTAWMIIRHDSKQRQAIMITTREMPITRQNTWQQQQQTAMTSVKVWYCYSKNIPMIPISKHTLGGEREVGCTSEDRNVLWLWSLSMLSEHLSQE